MPLGAKFVLTLYMGRYLSLHDFGMYGYIFATVIILTTALGQRLDFIVTRDIVDMPADIALQKIRDGAYFYLANYVVLALVIFGLIGIHAVDLPAKAMIYILALSVLESFCTVLNTNMNALNQQLLANLVFFIRAGVWVLPVMVLGLMNPAYRTYDAVLIGWAGGATLSLFATLWCWRDMPWREVMQRPFDWNWLVNGVKKSSLLWIGMIGLIGGSFADRYIVEYFLGWDYVAVLTFYASFTNAILTLMQSGIIVFFLSSAYCATSRWRHNRISKRGLAYHPADGDRRYACDHCFWRWSSSHRSLSRTQSVCGRSLDILVTAAWNLDPCQYGNILLRIVRAPSGQAIMAWQPAVFYSIAGLQYYSRAACRFQRYRL